MGSKASTTNFKFSPSLIFFFTSHSVCGKKTKTCEIRGQMIKNGFFGSVPKSATQMGSLSVKNASEKCTVHCTQYISRMYEYTIPSISYRKNSIEREISNAKR
jgi:hypothetical protein